MTNLNVAIPVENCRCAITIGAGTEVDWTHGVDSSEWSNNFQFNIL